MNEAFEMALIHAIGARDINRMSALLDTYWNCLDEWDRAYLNVLTCYVTAWCVLDKEVTVKSLKRGIEGVDQALPIARNASDQCEILVLLAGCCGLLAQLNPLKSIKWGRIFDGAVKQAEMLSARRNPRLLFLKGLVLVKRPVYAGGGEAAALLQFQSAESEFQRLQTSRRPVCQWGEAENAYWLACCALSEQLEETAHVAIAKALRLCPVHAPALELQKFVDAANGSGDALGFHKTLRKKAILWR